MKRTKSDSNFLSKNLNVISNLLGRNGSYVKLSRTQSFEVNENAKRCKIDETKESKNLYPNCESTVWLRSCEHEVIEPISGEISGNIPKWLKGTLLRNGPGSLKVGKYTFNHLFDSAALLHSFRISDGKVTYQRRFVETETFKKNQAAQKIVFTEFGTSSIPDPCKTIFHRISAIFNPEGNATDNSMISIYPFGDEFYTFTESPIIHRIDPKTLETLGKVNVSNYVAIVSHTSHPHIMKDGTVYNLGMSMTSRGPVYSIVKFLPNKTVKDDSEVKKKNSMFDNAQIVANVPARWFFHPSYMHTFGVTENYFIIVEQPFSVSLIPMVKNKFRNEPMRNCMKWHEGENTHIYLISRKNGQIKKTFISEGFFYFHIINQFETSDKDYVVLDICAYRDAEIIDCMYVDAIKDMQSNPDYANLFRGRPLRFILPMKDLASNTPPEENLIKAKTVNQMIIENLKDCEMLKKKGQNCESLLQRKATAHRLPNGKIFVNPELLCDLGLETPQINYNCCLGKEYQYFYGISSDVDAENPGMIIKVDAVNKTKKIWWEDNVYPSEAIFVPTPGGKTEDDGVILSALIWGQDREKEVGLLILNASTLEEIGRATFVTPGPVTKSLHGWFTSDV